MRVGCKRKLDAGHHGNTTGQRGDRVQCDGKLVLPGGLDKPLLFLFDALRQPGEILVLACVFSRKHFPQGSVDLVDRMQRISAEVINLISRFEDGLQDGDCS